MKDFLKNQKGLFSAFVLILLVTLGLLGLGAYRLMQSEGVNIAHHTEALQAEYSAISGIFYAFSAYEHGTLSDMNLEIANTNVHIDTQRVESDYRFFVQSSKGDARRNILVDMAFQTLADVAIYSDSTVTGVQALDSAGQVDNNRLIKEANVMPKVNNSALRDSAMVQGHYFGGDYNLPDGYPSTNFYFSPNVPNVIWISGNVTLNGNEHIYGILVIEGNLTVNGTPRIEGVIYMPHKNSMIINGGGSPYSPIVNGGIVSFGLIRRTGQGKDRYIRHWPEYMRKFCDFVTWAPVNKAVVAWRYIKSTD